MIKMVIYIAYSFFKNLSVTKNSGFLEKGLAIISINLIWHLLVIIKFIYKVDNFESLDNYRTTIIFSIIIFAFFLSSIFSFFISRKFLNSCILKYKKIDLINSTGGVVFVLYFIANSIISSFILINKTTLSSYILFAILPGLFYFYYKIIDSYNN